ncbi:MAG: aldo/keto reductase [Planctomycetes bacterium]|nr:aldo/keto reductase [Planctomycetota bacterium]
MQYRSLGTTGIQVSVLSFGAGPVSGLMVGEDTDRPRHVVEQALARGINWFDTAATYGQGQSERNLGQALADLKSSDQVHVATKVRLTTEDLGDIRGAVRRSLEGSLTRLRLSRVALLQLHNSITANRGDEPTSVTTYDVLGPGGIADEFQRLCQEGLIENAGLTGIGHPAALAEVVHSGGFATIQVPYHLLNPSAGQDLGEDFVETNYGNIIAKCAQAGMGVFAIRVLAGGALAGRGPSAHTLKTPFFPLPLFERDRERAAQLQASLGPDCPLSQESIRFALSHPSIHSAIIGFGDTSELDDAIVALETLPTH